MKVVNRKTVTIAPIRHVNAEKNRHVNVEIKNNVM